LLSHACPTVFPYARLLRSGIEMGDESPPSPDHLHQFEAVESGAIHGLQAGCQLGIRWGVAQILGDHAPGEAGPWLPLVERHIIERRIIEGPLVGRQLVLRKSMSPLLDAIIEHMF